MKIISLFRFSVFSVNRKFSFGIPSRTQSPVKICRINYQSRGSPSAEDERNEQTCSWIADCLWFEWTSAIERIEKLKAERRGQRKSQQKEYKNSNETKKERESSLLWIDSQGVRLIYSVRCHRSKSLSSSGMELIVIIREGSTALMQRSKCKLKAFANINLLD